MVPFLIYRAILGKRSVAITFTLPDSPAPLSAAQTGRHFAVLT